jgi:hypothetical protein
MDRGISREIIVEVGDGTDGEDRPDCCACRAGGRLVSAGDVDPTACQSTRVGVWTTARLKRRSIPHGTVAPLGVIGVGPVGVLGYPRDL